MFPLPKPYPDEIVGSVLIRSCRRFGISIATLSDRLFGSPRKFVPMLMSSGIREIAESSGIDQNAYLWKHTIFPYAVAFLPAIEVQWLQHKAILSQKPIQFGTLTYAVNLGASHLRYCRVCVMEDKLVFGESYWHRSHQLPATYICTKHNQFLYETKLPSKKMQIPAMALPQDLIGEKCYSENIDIIKSISELSVGLLNHQELIDNDNQLNIYRSIAIESGYIRKGRFNIRTPLPAELHVFYGSDFLRNQGCDFVWNSRIAWPASMLKEKAGIRFTTVKHVLLQVFLKFNHVKNNHLSYQKKIDSN